MEAEVNAQGLLHDLRQLSEAGRVRHLKALTPEEKDQVLLAALRDNHLKGVGTVPPAISNYKQTIPEDIDIAPIGITAGNAVAGKRGRPAATPRATKRAKNITVVPTMGFDSSNSLNETTRASPNGSDNGVLKEEPESIDLTRNSDDGNGLEDDGSPTRPRTRPRGLLLSRDDPYATQIADRDAAADVSKTLVELPIVLSVPESNSIPSLKPFSELPVDVRTELKRRHTDSWMANKSRKEYLLRLTRTPAKFLDKPFCIRDQLCRGGRLINGGKPVRLQDFGLGGQPRMSSDDTCILRSHPFLHLIAHNGTHALCLVPLPEGFRDGKTWKELEFWVRG